MTSHVPALSPVTPTPSLPAWSSQTLRAPRRVVDCPLELDDEQLLEIIQSFQGRTHAIGMVGAAATASIAVVLSPVLWFAALALMPAALGGLVASNRAMARASASRFGVTPACLRLIEVTFDAIFHRRDLSARDLVRTDWRSLVLLLKAELVRQQQG